MDCKRLFLIAMWMGFVIALPAYGAKPNVLNFYRHQYQAANKNWAVVQDAQGILYFGNDNGLLEFDGVRWQLYSPPGDKVVRALATGKDGRIYSGGYEEFGYWQPTLSGSLEYMSLSSQLPEDVMHNDDIWRILLTDDCVYFQSFRQVYIYDPESGQVSACRNAAGDILFLHNVHTRLWVQAINGALYELKEKEFVRIPGSDFLQHTVARVILPFGEDWLIGTSSMGMFLYDGQRFEPWVTDFSGEALLYDLNNGILGSNGHYFFGTTLNGMYEVDMEGRIINHLSADNLLQNNTVLNLYEEQSGNVWLALDRGLSYVQYLDRMDCYIAPRGDVGAVYSSAIYKGDLYIGTNQGLFFLPMNDLGPDSWRLRPVEDITGQIWDLKEKNGDLLCGHNNGLKIISDGRRAVSVPGVSGVYRIQELEVGGREALFLGTYTTANVVRKDEGGWRKITNRDLAQFAEPVYSIRQDHLGNVWLEHVKGGVYRCIFSTDMSYIKHLQRYDHPGAHLRMFRIGDRVVFAANDSLFVYDDIDDRLTYHEALSRCLEGIRNLRNIVPVSKTRFWAVTDHCLYDVFYDGHESQIYYKFDLNAGNLALIDHYENIVVLNDSLSLVCLENGFLLHTMSPGNLPADRTYAKPRLRFIAAVDKKKRTSFVDPGAQDTRLAFEYNTLRLGFFVKDMLSQKRYFQTLLAGVDERWSEPVQQPEVVYERLPEGDYLFRLRTTDAFGQSSEEETFRFTILPPWYFSPWAYAGYALALLLLSYAGWKFWFRQMRNRQILLVRFEEEERLRQINNELHAEIEHKSAELYAQTLELINKGDWKAFLLYFEEYHKDFFGHLISKYPDLTSNDLKLCACLKSNLSSKEIAALMGISLRGVENSRYRLRKKLHLEPSQNLSDFFLRL